MSTARSVSLVLCDAAGELLGTLPAFTVEDPWWQEVESVVTTARERFTAEVFILRLLDVTSDADNGGHATYLAELVTKPMRELPLKPAGDAGEDEPLRQPWARPGGVSTTIAWADGALAQIGRTRVGPVVQIKTWNLSSVLQLPTADGDVWCKSVPPFLTHEGSIIALVGEDDPAVVPPLLASDREHRTVLLGDVAGADDWNAPEGRLVAMVQTLVRLQARLVDRIDDLFAAGLPDWRSRALTRLVETLVARADVRVQLTGPERAALDALTESLPGRFAELDTCGIPDTVVHGDFHPGNWRSDGESLVLLDWGDVGVGHPMLDISSFLAYVPEEAQPRVREAWIDAWRRERPGSDPAAADTVLAPIEALRRAVIYQRFLDRIEPSERRYHEADVRNWLRAAIEQAAIPGE